MVVGCLIRWVSVVEFVEGGLVKKNTVVKVAVAVSTPKRWQFGLGTMMNQFSSWYIQFYHNHWWFISTLFIDKVDKATLVGRCNKME